MIEKNFIGLIEDSIKKNWKTVAFADFHGLSYKYGTVADKIANLHCLFEAFNIQKGDKISLIGQNSSAWGIAFLATITFGAVIVPILSDFQIDEIHEIINHSDSKLLFSADSVEGIDIDKLPQVKAIFSLNQFSLVICKDEFKTLGISEEKLDHLKILKYQGAVTPKNINYEKQGNEKLALISYTSGTTGFPKGVMLSFNSLAANVIFARDNMPLKPADRIVSVLPLAHSYGCAFEFLFPFTLGCHIVFITENPSPQVLINAYQEIRPRLILTVPLIIEKIYKKSLLPKVEKFPLILLLKIPLVNQIFYSSIRKKLNMVFGNNFHEVVLGGAALNKEVEVFFKKIKFPFTVGYGMTECGPLISYSPWFKTKLTSSGKLIDYLEIKIGSADPYNEVGEIILKGENLMDGYYKNEEATKKVIDEDVWLHTGDLGIIDKDNTIFIKGRSIDMMLGANGQNIYPGEIEAKLNNIPVFMESVIIEENKKLVALVYPDYEFIKSQGLGPIENQLGPIKSEINKSLPKYMQISAIRVHNEEFEKTPKKSIKRYLYQPSG